MIVEIVEENLTIPMMLILQAEMASTLYEARQDGWIDVDILPTNGTYLVYTSKGRTTIADFLDGQFDDYPLAYEEDGEYYTHYQPLPSAPKEK